MGAIPCRISPMSAPYIVAIGGTLRANSTTERAMRYVLDAAQRAGARTKLISGPSLQLPLYQPDNPERSDAARDLVAGLALADGIVLGSPGDHGSISGLVKNALDYAEDLRTDVRPYFSGRAVGCIATAGGGSAAGNTLGGPRGIVHALRGWPDAPGRRPQCGGAGIRRGWYVPGAAGCADTRVNGRRSHALCAAGIERPTT